MFLAKLLASDAELSPVPSVQCTFPAVALKEPKLVASLDAIVKRMHEASPYLPPMALALSIHKPELAEKWASCCIVQDVATDASGDMNRSIRFVDRAGSALFLALYDCGYSKDVVSAVRQLLYLLGDIISSGRGYHAELDKIPTEEDGSLDEVPASVRVPLSEDQVEFFKQLSSCLEASAIDFAVMMSLLQTLDPYAADAIALFLTPQRFQGATIKQILNTVSLTVRRGRMIQSPLTRELLQLFFDVVVSSDQGDHEEVLETLELCSDRVGSKRPRTEADTGAPYAE